ncbi:YoaK family protein [Enterovirga sp.]|uniref:YoaK family protein n=1 Tax=Enterovirga sp. TaxID=2026350 RepID=UPI002B940BC9|nr:YoaK family protein [Enterovirga sp.]HMO30531.1 YoaK family protein [Enterovirga sp.]
MNIRRFIFGLLLTGGAGAIDAVSFMRLGAVYASFMSGNTVQLGIHVGEGSFLPLLGFSTLIGLFMLGSFTGSIVTAKAGSRNLPVILALEVAALSVALLLDLRHGMPLATTAPLAFAMGAQNHLVVMARGSNPGTTFVTGTAFRFADAVAQRALGRDPAGAWKLHLAVWMSFAVGASGGAVFQIGLREHALAPILALLALLLTVSLVAQLVRPGLLGSAS